MKGDRMTYIERKKYLIFVSTAFVTGFVLYGFIGLFLFFDKDISQQQTLLQRVLTVIGIGVLGGYLISAILSGILLFANYIREKSTRFKVLAIVLFMLTVQLIALAGFILNLPVYFSNLVKVLKRRQIIEK